MTIQQLKYIIKIVADSSDLHRAGTDPDDTHTRWDDCGGHRKRRHADEAVSH